MLISGNSLHCVWILHVGIETIVSRLSVWNSCSAVTALKSSMASTHLRKGNRSKAR